MPECSFKLNHYKDVLKQALKLDYKISAFKDYPKINKFRKIILLRHDIDFNIERALEVAKIDNNLGIKATYFVRLHAKDYNPFEFKAYTILREILKMGHEIGLHSEALDVSHITKENPVEIFKREKEILESILNIKIASAAQHGDFTGISRNYANYFFGKYKKEDVRILYQPFEDRFFKAMKYISDSLGSWREGCMCQHIGKFDRLQICTHPNYWFYKFYHLK